jgi:hypothetical protein
MHFARLVIEIKLPEQLYAGNIIFAENGFIALPAIAFGTSAVGGPIGGEEGKAGRKTAKRNKRDSH